MLTSTSRLRRIDAEAMQRCRLHRALYRQVCEIAGTGRHCAGAAASLRCCVAAPLISAIRETPPHFKSLNAQAPDHYSIILISAPDQDSISPKCLVQSKAPKGRVCRNGEMGSEADQLGQVSFSHCVSLSGKASCHQPLASSVHAQTGTYQLAVPTVTKICRSLEWVSWRG